MKKLLLLFVLFCSGALLFGEKNFLSDKMFNILYKFDCGVQYYEFDDKNQFYFEESGGMSSVKCVGKYFLKNDNNGNYIEFIYKKTLTGEETNGVEKVLGVDIKEKSYYYFINNFLFLYDNSGFYKVFVESKDYESMNLDYAMPLCSHGVLSSSFLPKDKYGTYNPENLTDVDLKTYWSEGTKGSGEKEKLIFNLNEDFSKSKVNLIIIFNGVFNNPKLFKENNRVKEIQISIDGKPVKTITLADKNDPQIFLLNQDNLTGNIFELSVVSVYKGGKWDDTCLTEVIIF